jgi:hypothetical protein
MDERSPESLTTIVDACGSRDSFDYDDISDKSTVRPGAQMEDPCGDRRTAQRNDIVVDVLWLSAIST